MKVLEKEHAIKLREQGFSINEIVSKLKVSKASVSIWVRKVILTKEQKNKLSKNGRSIESIEKRRLSRLKNEQNKINDIMNYAKLDFSSISLHELKIIGTVLYLGEGGKTKKGMVRIANSDPAVVQIMMRFFRQVCEVPERKFRVHIHTFNYADIGKTENYWSQITKVPRSQFYKTYIKQSIASSYKRKTLPWGTCDISVNDTKLFLTIMGWIEKIKELVLL